MFNGNFIHDIDPHLLDLSAGGLYTKVSLDPMKNNYFTSNYQDYLQNGVLSNANNVLTLNTTNSSSYIDATAYRGLIIDSLFYKDSTALNEISIRDLFNVNSSINGLEGRLRTEIAAVDTKVNVIYGADGSASGYNLTDLHNAIVGLQSGDMTINGQKTFSSSPVVPTPTVNTAAANKEYVDEQVRNNAGSGESNLAIDPMPNLENLYLQTIKEFTTEYNVCLGTLTASSYRLEVMLGSSVTDIIFLFTGIDPFGIFPELNAKCQPDCTGYQLAGVSTPVIKDSSFTELKPFLDAANITSFKVLSTIKIDNKNLTPLSVDISTDPQGLIQNGSYTGIASQYTDYKNRTLAPAFRTNLNYYDQIDVDLYGGNATNIKINGDQAYANILVTYTNQQSLDYDILTTCSRCSKRIFQRRRVDLMSKVLSMMTQGTHPNHTYITRPMFFPYCTYMLNTMPNYFVYLYPKGNSLIVSMTTITPSQFIADTGTYTFNCCFAAYGELEYYFPLIYKVDYEISSNDINYDIISRINYRQGSPYSTIDALPFLIPMEVQDTIVMTFTLVTKDNNMYFAASDAIDHKILSTKTKNSNTYQQTNNFQSLFFDSDYTYPCFRECLYKCNTTLLKFRNISWGTTIYISKQLIPGNIGNGTHTHLISHPNQYTLCMYYYPTNLIEIYGAFRLMLFDMSSTGLDNVSINPTNNTPFLVTSSMSTYLAGNRFLYNTLSAFSQFWSYMKIGIIPQNFMQILGGTNFTSFGISNNFLIAARNTTAAIWPYPAPTLVAALEKMVGRNEMFIKYCYKPVSNTFIMFCNTHANMFTIVPSDQWNSGLLNIFPGVKQYMMSRGLPTYPISSYLSLISELIIENSTTENFIFIIFSVKLTSNVTSLYIPLYCRFKASTYKGLRSTLPMMTNMTRAITPAATSEYSDGTPVYRFSSTGAELFLNNTWTPMPSTVYDLINSVPGIFTKTFNNQVFYGNYQMPIHKTIFDYVLLSKCYMFAATIWSYSSEACQTLTSVEGILNNQIIQSITDHTSQLIGVKDKYNPYILDVSVLENKIFTKRNIYLTPLTPTEYVPATNSLNLVMIPNTFPYYKFITDFKYNMENCFLYKSLLFPVNTFPGDVYVYELSFIMLSIDNVTTFNPYRNMTISDMTLTYQGSEEVAQNLTTYKFTTPDNVMLSFTMSSMGSEPLCVFNYGKIDKPIIILSPYQNGQVNPLAEQRLMRSY